MDFDVRDYGAVFDGVTDDTDAIELASLAAAVVRGTILLPEGVGIVSWRENPDAAGIWRCVDLRTGCTLRGAGIGATTLRLAANQPDHSASANIVINHRIGGGDEDITYADFTVDGNGANQDTLYNGVHAYAATNAKIHRVRALNVRGTGNSPPGETQGIACSLCDDVEFIDCVAEGTAGTQGSGICANSSTNVYRRGCVATGMSEGFGFTSWHAQVLNVNCTARGNGTSGFNVEVSQGVRYTGCMASGNAASGFTVNESEAEIVLCVSKDNGNNGVDFVVGSSGAVIDSVISGNVNDPVYFDESSLPNCSVVSDGSSYPAAWLTPENAAAYGVTGALTEAGVVYLGARTGYEQGNNRIVGINLESGAPLMLEVPT